ncbi:MAG: hypothetical protein PVG78_10330 [Desulfobacterales bacterium]|jgi:hypothetical protein
MSRNPEPVENRSEPGTSFRPGRLARLLLVDSAKDLFRYKSFFLLIFALILADRILKKTVSVDRSAIQLPNLAETGLHTARFVFEELPGAVGSLLTDYRTFLALGGLFLLKQLISMWPSSDMRRMHRKERSGFGLLDSLTAIRWAQVAWDAVAVGSICAATGLWCLAAFLFCRILWTAAPTLWPLLMLATLVALFLPLSMGGFSFSSKLAVLQRGGFGEKLLLFFRLLTDARFMRRAWLFFMLRIALESVFVVAIPAAVLLFVDIFWLRILLAGLLATPVYSYLKMVTFKFFLAIYSDTALVREEYLTYYAALAGGHATRGPRRSRHGGTS